MNNSLPSLEEAKQRVLSITMMRMLALARVVKTDASPIELDALTKAVYQFVCAIRCSTVANIDNVLRRSPPPESLTKKETLAAISLFLNQRVEEYITEITRVDDQLRNLIEEIIKSKENKK